MKGSLGVPVALHVDPLAEPVAIDVVGQRDTGVTVAFDIVQEPAEAFIPLLRMGVPGPAWKFLKSRLTVGGEGAAGVLVALAVDPSPEPVAIHCARS